VNYIIKDIEEIPGGFTMKLHKVKYVLVGAMIGMLFSSSFAFAAVSKIKLMINGAEVVPAVAPQMVKGTVLVPLRLIAETLGADVEFRDNTVFVNKTKQQAENNSLKGYFIKESDLVSLFKSLQTEEERWMILGSYIDSRRSIQIRKTSRIIIDEKTAATEGISSVSIVFEKDEYYYDPDLQEEYYKYNRIADVLPKELTSKLSKYDISEILHKN
jgi:hypothetical protein